MHWLQIVVEHIPNAVTLTVNDTIHCKIEGNHLLAQSKITAYSGAYSDTRDAILPPESPGPVPTALPPFHVLFVGGVPRVMPPRRSHRMARRAGRTAFYISNIPSLVGCVRGLMVNWTIVDMRHTGERPWAPEGQEQGKPTTDLLFKCI